VDRVVYDILNDPADLAALRVSLGIATPFIGSFSRDATTASGTQAVTGVGFAPTFVLFFATINGTSPASWGFMTALNNFGIFDDDANAAGTHGVASNRSIYISHAGAAAVTFDFNAFGADGFTFDVIKTNSPTGTITVQYAAFRI
jgi:hypothetical protein